jgi:hypothetical protein
MAAVLAIVGAAAASNLALLALDIWTERSARSRTATSARVGGDATGLQVSHVAGS